MHFCKSRSLSWYTRKKNFKNGDIINIDVTPILNGWHGDTSRMFHVGKVSLKAQKLIETTYEAMMRGIEMAKPGNTTGDIGNAIQKFAESKNYSVVRDFCGHGLGEVFHDNPSILHFGNEGDGELLKEGMFFTVEPMINIGSFKVKVLSDGWTAVTSDKKLSAQFEHSIGIKNSGPGDIYLVKKEILLSTISPMIPRYSRNKLKEIWDPHNKFSIWLQIELLICEAQQKLGNIPKSLDNIKKYSSFDIKRIDEIEKSSKT